MQPGGTHSKIHWKSMIFSKLFVNQLAGKYVIGILHYFYTRWLTFFFSGWKLRNKMTVFSKLFAPVYATCTDYVHPWTPSCYTASAGLLLHALQASFRLYVTVYVVSSILKNVSFSMSGCCRVVWFWRVIKDFWACQRH